MRWLNQLAAELLGLDDQQQRYFHPSRFRHLRTQSKGPAKSAPAVADQQPSPTPVPTAINSHNQERE